MSIVINYSAPGRSAWTSVGGLRNLAGTGLGNQYRSTVGTKLPPIGSEVYLKSLSAATETVHINDYAVWRGALEIQRELRRLGFYTGVLDGSWGPATDTAIKNWQRYVGRDHAGKPMIIDGIYGQQTARTMWQPVMLQAFRAKANQFAFMPSDDNIEMLNDYARATVMLESVWDIAAVGGSTPKDNGLCQINTGAHNVASADAFNPHFAFNFKANLVLDNFAYGLGDLQIGMVSYNVGQGGAWNWHKAGRPSDWAAANYLRALRQHLTHPRLVAAVKNV